MKKKRAVKRTKKAALHVAVVAKPGAEAWAFVRSGRAPHGDWASFVGTDQDAVLAAAFKAKADWEPRGFGPYEIILGELTQRVVQPTNYKLVKL